MWWWWWWWWWWYYAQHMVRGEGGGGYQVLARMDLQRMMHLSVRLKLVLEYGLLGTQANLSVPAQHLRSRGIRHRHDVLNPAHTNEGHRVSYASPRVA